MTARRMPCAARPVILRGRAIVALLALLAAGPVFAQGPRAPAAPVTDGSAESESVARAIAAARAAKDYPSRSEALTSLSRTEPGRVQLLRLTVDADKDLGTTAMGVLAQTNTGGLGTLRRPAYREVLATVLEPLAEIACTDGGPRGAAAFNLIQNCVGPGPGFEGVVVKYLGSPDRTRRTVATHLLYDVPPDAARARDAAVRLLPDGDPSIRAAAARWLARSDAGRAALRDAVKWGPTAQRVLAMQFIVPDGQRATAEQIATLAELMTRDADPEVRDAAAGRLAMLDPGGALPVFVAAVRDGSVEVRRTVLKHVQGGAETAAAFVPLLDVPDPAVRAAAAQVLASEQRRRFAPTRRLVELLDDPDPEVSMAAAGALQAWPARGPVSARRLTSLAAVSDVQGMRVVYQRDPPPEPASPPWADAPPASSAPAASGGRTTLTRLGPAVTVATLAVSVLFAVMAAARSAGRGPSPD